MQKSTSLKYEPSLELLRITAEQLFLNPEPHTKTNRTPNPQTSNLKTLDQVIGLLTGLRDLRLSGNQLASLPSEVT